MIERPILFSAPMVRAILEGRKTMTRRVINWKNIAKQADCTRGSLAWFPAFQSFGVHGGDVGVDVALVDCPYGQPGDRLWVRETWVPLSDIGPGADPDEFLYRADGEDADVTRWRPSIYMPRWASRIDLEITAIRVERVQDISDDDIGREGLRPGNYPPGKEQGATVRRWFEMSKQMGSFEAAKFANLWDSINAKRGYSWDANPWVWVIEFKKVN